MSIILASSIAETGRNISEHLKARENKLSLAFITTAAETDAEVQSWLNSDRQGLIDGGFEVQDYTITGKSYEQIKNDLKDFDVIHVNGGNTFYLLMKIRESGFDLWIKEALQAGKTYIGSSAGSIVAAPNIEITKRLETLIFAEQLGTFEGLNLVDIIVLPHWGGADFKDLYLNQRLEHAYRQENKIILLNDFQYLFCEEDSFRFVDIRG